MKKIITILLILIYSSILTALTAEQTIEYDYIIRSTDSIAMTDSEKMVGDVEKTERYKRLTRKYASTTLDNYVTQGRVIKIPVEITTDGIAVYRKHLGNYPSDYHYNTKLERMKTIEAEKERLKKLQDEELEAQAILNLGL